MASLQARHQIGCAIVVRRADGNSGKLNRWTTFKDARKPACDCKPDYHLVYRVDGKLIREPVGHDRQTAERELKAHEGDEARGTVRRVKDIRFDAWADEWLAAYRGKESTRKQYSRRHGCAKRSVPPFADAAQE